jgi:plasmid stabilization system protein ParE
MTSSIELIIQPRTQRDIRNTLQYTLDTWGSGQQETCRQVLDRAFERIQVFPDIGHPGDGKPSNSASTTSGITSSIAAVNPSVSSFSAS